MNKENLKKLADYLLSGELKAKFDMRIYDDASIGYHTTCGTIGCAAGHGPYAGCGLKIPYEAWYEYIIRVFDIGFDELEWCFAAKWICVDNTPEGAAKRILYMIEKGVPYDWEKQMGGEVPLCY